jgi:hypothetical protein
LIIYPIFEFDVQESRAKKYNIPDKKLTLMKLRIKKLTTNKKIILRIKKLTTNKKIILRIKKLTTNKKIILRIKKLTTNKKFKDVKVSSCKKNC